jgi:hypothetical protein
MASDAYEASPNEQVHDQVALYEATDGREGGTLEGRPVVILTTIGAKSGSIRKNPVMRVHLVRAREVHGEEKARWWQIAERDWPHFPEYRASAGDREIPVLLLEPRG